MVAVMKGKYLPVGGSRWPIIPGWGDRQVWLITGYIMRCKLLCGWGAIALLLSAVPSCTSSSRQAGEQHQAIGVPMGNYGPSQIECPIPTFQLWPDGTYTAYGYHGQSAGTWDYEADRRELRLIPSVVSGGYGCYNLEFQRLRVEEGHRLVPLTDQGAEARPGLSFSPKFVCGGIR
jgi:hypothetical protein